MAPAPGLTMAYLNYFALMNYPLIACQVLIFFEAIRTIPGEARMYMRMRKRGKINIAEILFVLTKYMALLAIISDAVTELTSGLLNPKGCNVLSWFYNICLFLCTTLISTTLAWRCFVIFQRQHRIGVYLLAGLTTQCVLALFTACSQPKYKSIIDGYCQFIDQDIASVDAQKWWQKRGLWFLIYSVVFDGALVVFTSYRLIKCVRGPSGLQRIGKLLFVNNLHYLLIVCGLNSVEFFLFVGVVDVLPNLLPLTIVIEIMIGLQLLISEQDAAHGYGKSWVQTGYHRSGRTPSTGTGAPRPSNIGQSLHSMEPKPLATTSTIQTSHGATSTVATGIEGIRYDCTEEVLVDYGLPMSQSHLSPSGEPWDGTQPFSAVTTDNGAPQYGNSASSTWSTHDGKDTLTVTSGQDRPFATPPARNQDLYPPAPHPQGTNGSAKVVSSSPSLHSNWSAPRTPTSPPQVPRQTAQPSGVSIRAIRANLQSQHSQYSVGSAIAVGDVAVRAGNSSPDTLSVTSPSEAGYETRPIGTVSPGAIKPGSRGSDSVTSATFSPTGTLVVSQDPLDSQKIDVKRADSMASFASVGTGVGGKGEVRGYGTAMTTPEPPASESAGYAHSDSQSQKQDCLSSQGHIEEILSSQDTALDQKRMNPGASPRSPLESGARHDARF